MEILKFSSRTQLIKLLWINAKKHSILKIMTNIMECEVVLSNSSLSKSNQTKMPSS